MNKIMIGLALMTAQLSSVSAEEFLIRQGDVAVSVTDIDAIVNNIPKNTRHGVMNDPKRIQQFIQTLMGHRLMSLQAQQNRIGEDPLVEREIQHAIEKIMAKHLITEHMTNLEMPDFSALAKEQYMVNKSSYVEPDSVSVSHILITEQNRSKDDAEALIESLRQRVQDGEDFMELAVEFSEDPSVATNKGRLNRVVQGQMVPEFEAAAFGLSEEQPLSDVVHTQFGYHIIMYHGRKDSYQQEFEEVEAEIIAQIRETYLSKRREEFVDQFLTGGPEVEFNQEAIESLRTRYQDGTIPSVDR